MKTNAKHNRLMFLAETDREKQDLKDLQERLRDSFVLTCWWGDITIDGKEITGFVITPRLQIQTG